MSRSFSLISLFSSCAAPLLALVLVGGLPRPAHAGQWVIKEWLRNETSKSQYWYYGNRTETDANDQPHDVPGVSLDTYHTKVHSYPAYSSSTYKPSRRVYNAYFPRSAPFGIETGPQGITNSQGGVLTFTNGAYLMWRSGAYATAEHPYTGAAGAGRSEATLSITPILKWEPDPENPNELPPTQSYFVEEASIEGYRFLLPNSNAQAIPSIENLQFEGMDCPFASSEEGNFPQVGATTTTRSHLSKGSNIYLLKNPARTLVIPGPTRTFSGAITLAQSVFQEPFMGNSLDARFNFDYKFKTLDLSISALPAHEHQYLKNQPTSKVINAEARLALRAVDSPDGAFIRAFWIGHSDFLAQAKVMESNGTSHDLFEQQKYLWGALHEPSVPIEPPAELTPSFPLGNIVLNPLSALANPVTRAWEDLEPWAKTTIKLGAQAAVGLEGTAVDGRPLGQLKTTVSRPDKHFYWDLGELQSEFPIPTETQVIFDSDTTDKAFGPAKVQINWQLPTRTVYDVEIGLWNWTDSQDADNPTWDEWKNRLLTDDDLAKTIAKDTAIELVGMIPVGRVGTAVGKRIAFRLIFNKKTSARVVAGVVDEAAVTITKRGPRREWWANHKIRTSVKDAVERADFPDPPSSDQTSPTPQPTPTREPDEEERKAKKETFIDPPELYLYHRNGSYTSNYFHGVAPHHSHPELWPEGYYLTNLPPDRAATLRAGQLSFALYGHPYEWGNAPTTISWQKVRMGEIVEKVDGIEVKRDPAVWPIENYPLRGSETLVAYHDWGYFVYSGLDSRRLVDDGQITFRPGNPGTADVPPGTGLPDRVPGRWADITDRANSIWFSTEPAVIDMDERINGRRLTEVPIQFHNGHPDFSPWMLDDGFVQLDPLQTTNRDFRIFMVGNSPYGRDNYESDRRFALKQQPQWLSNGEPDFWRVRTTWRRRPQTATNIAYSWHHHQDMRTMQLIPEDIHENIPHSGGARWAAIARW